MSQLPSDLVSGLPFGCVYALVAIGLVLTYRTSGVFNLAFGAQAYVVALVFNISMDHGWPAWLAFVIWVVVFAPATGVILDRLLFQHVRASSIMVRLVSAIGLLIAVPQLAQLLYGTGRQPNPHALWLDPAVVYFRVASYPVNGGAISTVVVTLVAGIGLLWLLHSSMLGLRMRAAVESPRLLELAGTDAGRVGAASWAISSFLAGLAGVLLAPILHSVDSYSMTSLVVAASATAVLGGLSSVLATFLGGLAMGVSQQVLAGYLPSGSVLSHGLRPAFPFIVLVAALLLHPAFRRMEESRDPMAACDPPVPPPEHVTRTHVANRWIRVGFVLFCAAVLASALTWIPGAWVFDVTQGVAFSIIFLSVTILTGMSGQVSLCQAAFAGVGAIAAAQLAAHSNLSVLVGVAAGGVLAAAVGAVVALPSLRLGGLSLALVTLGFGLLADNLIFPEGWALNGQNGMNVPRPELGPVSFAPDKPYFILLLGILALSAALVVRVRNGTTGRFLRAISSSERAAQSVGINTARSRVVVFALSAGMAGIGGALYASVQETVSQNDFNFMFSLVFVVIVLALGVRTVEGAIWGGIAYTVIGQLLPSAGSNRLDALEPVLFGVLAIYYALHPEGIVERQRRLITGRIGGLWRVVRGLERVQRPERPAGLDRFEGPEPAGDGGGRPAPVPERSGG